MYKIIYNNQIIDVIKELRFVKYLPKTKKIISTNERQANGIISSNGEEIYHLIHTKNVFPAGYKSVKYIQIDEEEYNRLTKQLTYNENLLTRLEELEQIVLELQKKLG